MNQIGRQAFGQALISSFSTTPVLPRYDWSIKVHHKSGGVKKFWHIGQFECPILKIKFELNKKICGAGSIDFGQLDFPIDAEDYVLIYYKNNLKYRAYIDTSVDLKGGAIKLIPYSQRFKNLLINNSYTAKTIDYILEDIVSELADDTGVEWNSNYVDTGDTGTYTIDYSGYESANKIFDELIKKLDDREWGTTADNFFTVYELESTVTQTFYATFDGAFTEIDQKKDFSKIKATRYQVFKKSSGSGETERIGEVGYGGSYPVLSIENEVGKKVRKFNVSELITDNTEALVLAYANLQANTVVSETIKMKNFDPSVWFPVMGKRIECQDSFENINRTVIFCDALSYDDDTMWNNGLWDGASLDTTDYIEGTSSIEFTSAVADTEIYYYFRFWGFAQTGNDLNIAGITQPALAGLSSSRVAFVDESDLKLRTYDFDGTNWSQTGNDLTIVGAGTPNPALAGLSSSRVAFMDSTNEDLRAYDFDGTDWSQVGNDLNIAGSGMPDMAALSSSRIAYIDGGHRDLRTYDFDGTNWSQVGNDFNIAGISNPALTALSSTRVAFIDSTNENLQVYDFDGADWSQVGNDFNIAGMVHPRLADLSSSRVAYFDYTNRDFRIYDFDGTDWSQTGSDLHLTGGLGTPRITSLSSTRIAFIDAFNDDLRTYSFASNENISFLHPEKIGFMIKSTYAGEYLTFYVGETGDFDEYIINIPSGSIWHYIDFDLLRTSFAIIKFKFNSAPPASTTVNIDRITMFMPHRSVYENNVILASFEIDKNGCKCALKLSDYDSQANDADFEFTRKIEKLEAIQQNT